MAFSSASDQSDDNPQSQSRGPKDAGGSAWGDRVRALKNIPPVLHFVWESGPPVVFWNVALRIVVAFLPVAIGIVDRGIFLDERLG